VQRLEAFGDKTVGIVDRASGLTSFGHVSEVYLNRLGEL